jgi:hypothetical protein
MKSKRSFDQDGSASVLLRKIGDVEIRLTTINQLFCKVGKLVVFPSLLGSRIVRWDDSTFMPGEEVTNVVRDKLMRQRDIRRKHWNRTTEEEDEAAWTYN